jgi:SAM-dependent methyltransferase
MGLSPSRSLHDRLAVLGLTRRGLAEAVAVPARKNGTLPLNAMCHPRAWNDPDWRGFGRLLALAQEDGWLHRKAFEWTQCVYGLERLGALGSDTVALGVGAGHECVLYYLANRTRLTVATDLYSGGFTDSIATEADPAFLDNPEKFAPFPYHVDRLVALPANGCHLPFADRTFDVVYSLSSVEHFGGHDRARDAVQEMARVLRPGGVACVATELILDGGQHSEYFTLDDLQHWIIRPSGLVMVEPLDLTPPPAEYLDDPVRLPDEPTRTPHVVLQLDRWKFTSVVLFMRKPTTAQLTGAALRRTASAVRRRTRGLVGR